MTLTLLELRKISACLMSRLEERKGNYLFTNIMSGSNIKLGHRIHLHVENNSLYK